MRNPARCLGLSCIFGLLLAGCRLLQGAADEPVAAAAVDTVPRAGLYLGFVELDAGATQIPASFDLVQVGSDAGATKYRGILRLSQGGWRSSEYAAVYFPNVVFQAATSTLVFAGGPAGFSLRTVHFAAGKLAGVVAAGSNAAKASGAKFQLSYVDNADTMAALALAVPTASVAPLLSGVYQGSCGGDKLSLQLEASRWVPTERNAPGVEGLFAGMTVSGRLSKPGGFGCAATQICSQEVYAGGHFEPLSGELVLAGAQQLQACSRKQDGLVCGDCALRLDRAASRLVQTALQEPGLAFLPSKAGALDTPVSSPFLPRATSDVGASLVAATAPAADAEYYGYLQHEQTQRQQLIALSLQASGAAEASNGVPTDLATPAAPTIVPPTAGLNLQASATLYFGEGDSSEFIVYKFQPTRWPKSGPLVLDGGGEAFLVIDDWQGSKLHGTWYAKSFGRVGSFDLQTGTVPPLARGQHALPRLAGLYRGDGFSMELAADANLSESPGDFYPLKLYGWIMGQAGEGEVRRRRAISGGSYDFYMDSLALRLDDGRILLARPQANGMQLYWPPRPRPGSDVAVRAVSLTRDAALR